MDHNSAVGPKTESMSSQTSDVSIGTVPPDYEEGSSQVIDDSNSQVLRSPSQSSISDVGRLDSFHSPLTEDDPNDQDLIRSQKFDRFGGEFSTRDVSPTRRGTSDITFSFFQPPELQPKEIEETNAELLGDNHVLEHGQDGLSPAAALAPIRGHGTPQLPFDPNLRRQPSDTDVTDLGNRLHGVKLQGRTLELPSAYQSDAGDPLQERLMAILQKTDGYTEKKGFFPRDILVSLIDEECVMNELMSTFHKVHDRGTLRNYARQICGVGQEGDPPLTSKKIFVTLVLTEKVPSIFKFLAEKVTDDDLPLAKVQRPGKNYNIFYLGRRSQPNVALDCFEDWTSAAILNFNEWQWTTISPFFAQSRMHKNVMHYKLQDEAILPFTTDSRRRADSRERREFESNFSQVYMINIHTEHHDFHGAQGTNPCFAVKRLFSRDKKDFDREVGILKKFSGNAHRHLVSLLSTFEQFNQYYLIFHWAKTDLQNYWEKQNPKPYQDRRTILWIAKQCVGIADGLSKVHRYESNSPDMPHAIASRQKSDTIQINVKSPGRIYGRHGDIKPANVLLYPDLADDDEIGTLKLSDFGLAEFRSIHSIYTANIKVSRSPSYRPPECDVDGGQVGPSYDIWTLGCLYLEFITWYLGGWDLVETFNNKRLSFDPAFHLNTDTFFEIRDSRAVIKPAVIEFINDLHAHEACSDFHHQFLDLIQYNMMIIKPKDLEIRGRYSCSEVELELRLMMEKCANSVDYASKAVPWSKDKGGA